jgi:hypothetical protein
MAADTQTFRQELHSILKQAETLGLVAVDVNSGSLHRRVGGYAGTDHRMPMCCEAMYGAMRPGDEVVEQVSSGKGASVVVRL